MQEEKDGRPVTGAQGQPSQDSVQEVAPSCHHWRGANFVIIGTEPTLSLTDSGVVSLVGCLHPAASESSYYWGWNITLQGDNMIEATLVLSRLSLGTMASKNVQCTDSYSAVSTKGAQPKTSMLTFFQPRSTHLPVICREKTIHVEAVVV